MIVFLLLLINNDIVVFFLLFFEFYSELSVSAMLSPRDFGSRNHVDSSFSSEALESTTQSLAHKYREHLYTRPRLTDPLTQIAEIETVL